MNICASCFKEYDNALDICPFCGAEKHLPPKQPIHIVPGTILNGRYLIGEAVGSGGFGILYKAWDFKLETVVAIKEFFCSRLMTRATGETEVIVGKKSDVVIEFEYRKKRFLDEARNLAKFSNNTYLTNVFEYFEANSTAYIVMEFLDGENLSEYTKTHGGKLDSDFAVHIISEIGGALSLLHSNKIIHRDIAPDNIFICSGEKERTVLLDLGAAYLPDAKSDINDIVMKPGYSPAEQYVDLDKVGVWSDIYALGATLYYILTGIKPDESTNRKLEDTVVPPCEADKNISENLSNAVMKAMAVEPHMRFKDVKEFIKAINGEKKVLTIAKEKKIRKRRRFSGILAACVALAIVGGTVYKAYDDKKSAQYLKDASIEVWCMAEENSKKASALKSVVDDFTGKFTNVKVDLKTYPSDIYFEQLETAAQNDALPDLFESSNAPQTVLDKAKDVSAVLKSEQAQSCNFLDRYDDYYLEKKQIPLGIEVPMACVITKGVTSLDYEGNTFSSLDNFGDVPLAIKDDAQDLVIKNFGDADFVSEDEFFNKDGNTAAVLLCSTMSINQIRKELTGYSKKFVYSDADEILCDFVYEWSLGGKEKNNAAAAQRLLCWMLGNADQNLLMISKCNNGEIPLNKTCFAEKISGNNYKPIEETYQKFSMSNLEETYE